MSSFWAFKQLFEIIGFPTSAKNDQPPSTKMVLLGADVSVHDTHVRAEIRTGRKDKLKAHISHVLQSNCLTPAAASKLRGKIGFYSSLLAGKLGRGMMVPLISRQYKQRETSLNPALTRCLVWWHSALGNLSPRTAPFDQLKPIGARKDAQGYGHIAAVYFGRSRVTSRLHLPQWLCELALEAEGESPIFIYEICAAILMVYIANQ